MLGYRGRERRRATGTVTDEVERLDEATPAGTGRRHHDLESRMRFWGARYSRTWFTTLAALPLLRARRRITALFRFLCVMMW